MVAETCTDCGLPEELCVCEDMDKSKSSELTVTVVDAGFRNKVLTVVKGIKSDSDRDELDTKLKQNLGCGGTIEDQEIHLQGDHTSNGAKDQLVEILESRNYTVTFE